MSLDLLMLLTSLLLLMTGYPVAFVLGGVSLIFSIIGWVFGILPSSGALPLRVFGIISNETFFAIPLFVLMGTVLEKARIAEELLTVMSGLLGKIPGGLAVSVTIVGGLLAASTGIVGATVVTMGLLSLPAMLKAGYSPCLATGSIAAAGTLGQIIPPSIVLVVLADQLSNAWQQSQRSMGNFAPEPFSVADLFAACVLPGLLLVTLYLLYQLVHSWRFPPARSDNLQAADQHNEMTVPHILGALAVPLGLILCVLGSIVVGLATPTEASALGAGGSLLLAGSKHGKHGQAILFTGMAGLILLIATSLMKAQGILLPSALQFQVISATGVLLMTVAFGLALINITKTRLLQSALTSAVTLTAVIFAIMIGATFFSLVFRDLGGDETIHHFLSNLPGGADAALIWVMLLMFALGFFLDFLEIIFIIVPLVAPPLLSLPLSNGETLSPAWLGVMMAINLQTSFLTPPFGFALFYLRSVAPQDVKTSDMYLGIIPFVLLQLFALSILWMWPELATWLPSVLFP